MELRNFKKIVSNLRQNIIDKRHSHLINHRYEVKFHHEVTARNCNGSNRAASRGRVLKKKNAGRKLMADASGVFCTSSLAASSGNGLPESRQKVGKKC